jgi:ubiquinone/menaquinone biosynthesis C-methylase UbiE
MPTMLNDKTKEKLKMRLYPRADKDVFEPLIKALDQYLQPGVRVLDAGCGEGTWILRDYRSKIGHLAGADVQAPKEHKMDEFVLCDMENIPLADAAFDVIVCYFVIEHLSQPQKVFAEFSRLLADGGIIIFRTPCIITPMFLLSRLTPVRWHEKIKRTILGSQEVDLFPTYYRCNTVGKLDKTLKGVGFYKETLESVEQMYSYFTFNRIAYAASLLASRLIQACPFTKPFRSQIIGVYRKLSTNDKAYAESTANRRRQAPVA